MLRHNRTIMSSRNFEMQLLLNANSVALVVQSKTLIVRDV